MASERDGVLRLEKFNGEAKQLVAGAQQLADEHKHSEVTPLHLLARGVERSPGIAAVFKSAGADPRVVMELCERALKRLPKTTDVAWDSSGGAAEWNYRMVWPVQLPCKLPRVKIAVWDEEITFGDNAIGEVLYNLQPLFNKALREKQAITHQREKWIKFSHPDFRGASIGEVCVEFWLVTAVHAEANPVGEAQDEPNQEPFLAKPRRNAAFSALTSGFDAFQRRRMLLLELLCVLRIMAGLIVRIMVVILLSTPIHCGIDSQIVACVICCCRFV